MSVEIIPFAEGEARLDWASLTDALAAGHALPRAQIDDTLLRRGDDALLSRSAWIDGMGILVKSATVFPSNAARGLSRIGGGACLYSDADGTLSAIIDFHLLTKWKTAGDSLLAAKRLARPESETVLIVGAGTVGRAVRSAYASAFPQARFEIWNRSPGPAEQLAREFDKTTVATELEPAVRRADIVISATMSTTPLIMGEWLQPGQHLDLIGAYRPDMREADDAALIRSRLFVDSFDTTLDHIGELKIPLERGVIARSDVRADFYDLDKFQRHPEDITLFKNGGGAHLDLMTAHYILERWMTR